MFATVVQHCDRHGRTQPGRSTPCRERHQRRWRTPQRNYQQGRGEDAELGWNIHRWIPVIGGGDTHAARERLKSPVGQTLQPLVGYCARW